jgi:hypothetical protein
MPRTTALAGFGTCSFSAGTEVRIDPDSMRGLVPYVPTQLASQLK